MDYKEYLQTQKWKDKRKEVLEFWEDMCALCCSEKNLHVHHRRYERLGWESINDLIVLCKKCHDKHHEVIEKNDFMRHFWDNVRREMEEEEETQWL